MSGDRLHGGVTLEYVQGHEGSYVLRFSRVRGQAGPHDVTAGLYEPDLEELKAVLGNVAPHPARVIDFLQELLAARLRAEKSFSGSLGDSVREMRATHKTQAVREVIKMLQEGDL